LSGKAQYYASGPKKNLVQNFADSAAMIGGKDPWQRAGRRSLELSHCRANLIDARFSEVATPDVLRA
jgi:hypothetical protein